MHPAPAMRPTVGVLIRFSNSAATLTSVLDALKRQTQAPDVILGVASDSTDASVNLMTAAGATVIHWSEPYAHSRVLNFGLGRLHTDLVLVLSSHTVLESPDAIERMASCFEDDRVACASGKWDADPYYSDAVDTAELQHKGLKFGSIYSNSMGMIRRAFWEGTRFDETLPTAEDYAWALAQLSQGRVCCRLDFRFSYQRGGQSREGEFARVVFTLARQHRLRVAWLGVKGSALRLLTMKRSAASHDERHAVKARLRAWLVSRV